TRDRFRFPDAAPALKRRHHQHEVHEQAGAKRDEQKNAEATEFTISRHDSTKLAENRRTDKRFSRAALLWQRCVNFYGFPSAAK
ncbi:MAG: hypothetical protein DMF39_07175, partial [Verrucomicrobia bacterium]